MFLKGELGFKKGGRSFANIFSIMFRPFLEIADFSLLKTDKSNIQHGFANLGINEKEPKVEEEEQQPKVLIVGKT